MICLLAFSLFFCRSTVFTRFVWFTCWVFGFWNGITASERVYRGWIRRDVDAIFFCGKDVAQNEEQNAKTFHRDHQRYCHHQPTDTLLLALWID